MAKVTECCDHRKKRVINKQIITIMPSNSVGTGKFRLAKLRGQNLLSFIALSLGNSTTEINTVTSGKDESAF